MDLMLLPLRRYADFQGRSRRSEYWLFALFIFLVQMVGSLLMMATGGGWGGRDAFTAGASLPSIIVSAALGLFTLYVIIPSVAVAFRRLHDTNRSAWWLLIGLIPFLGGLVLFIFNVLDGTPGDNRFGPDPKASTPL